MCHPGQVSCSKCAVNDQQNFIASLFVYARSTNTAQNFPPGPPPYLVPWERAVHLPHCMTCK